MASPRLGRVTAKLDRFPRRLRTAAHNDGQVLSARFIESSTSCAGDQLALFPIQVNCLAVGAVRHQASDAGTSQALGVGRRRLDIDGVFRRKEGHRGHVYTRGQGLSGRRSGQAIAGAVHVPGRCGCRHGGVSRRRF